MKNFYYKYSTYLKIIILSFLGLILLITPLILILINDEKNGTSVKSEDFYLNATFTGEKNKFQSNISGQNVYDWNIEFDYPQTKGWIIDDYYMIISDTSMETPNSIPLDNYHLWTPNFNTNFEATNSLAYKSITFSNDENKSLLKEAILKSSEFKNDEKKEIKNLSYGERARVFVGAEFSNSETMIKGETKEFNVGNDSVEYFDLKTPSSNNPNDINVLLDDLSISTLNEPKIGSNSFDDFLFDGNILRGDNLTNELSPKFYIDGLPVVEVEGLKLKWIFKELPKIDLKIYATNDDPTLPVSEEDVLIYDATEVMDYEISENYIVMPIQKITTYDTEGKLYDAQNNLLYSDIKIIGTLSWEYYDEEKIVENLHNAFPKTDEDDIDITFKGAKTGLIEFGTEENPAKANDSDIFYKIFQFDKSIPANYLIYPHWDKNGIFDITLATKDKYIYSSDLYSDAVSNLQVSYEMKSSTTGKRFYQHIYLDKFDEVLIGDEIIYVSQNSTKVNPAINDSYYIDYNSSSTQDGQHNGVYTLEWRKGKNLPSKASFYYNAMVDYPEQDFDFITNKSFKKDGYVYDSGKRRFKYNDEIKFTHNIDDVVDIDSTTVLLPDNIQENLSTTLSTDTFLLFVWIVFMIMLIILPTSLLIFFIAKNKFSKRNK